MLFLLLKNKAKIILRIMNRVFFNCDDVPPAIGIIHEIYHFNFQNETTTTNSLIHYIRQSNFQYETTKITLILRIQ